MSDEDPIRGQAQTSTPTLRDIAMVLFRQRRVFLCISGLVLGLAILYALTGTKYQANMRVLVRRGRLYPPLRLHGRLGRRRLGRHEGQAGRQEGQGRAVEKKRLPYAPRRAMFFLADASIRRRIRVAV